MIAIVSHDAGGAEILSSWLRRYQYSYCLVLDGPAKDIFRRKIGLMHITSLSNAIEQSDWILCGTSWQSNLERQAIKKSKRAKKKVVVFLDHWVNYSERFVENGITEFPDEIWVGDIYAERIACSILPRALIKLKPNPYFEDLQQEFCNTTKDFPSLKDCSVLYVCEPIREHALIQYGDENHLGYTEKDALLFFLQNLNILGFSINNIKIRPHPSESLNKYDWTKLSSPLVEIGGNKTLLEEISEADVVVGCESMAMVVGLLANRIVFSSIPPNGKSCSLPYLKIRHIQQLL